jgi:hypothetical protein
MENLIVKKPEIVEAFKWIAEQVEKNPFADIGFKITTNDGRIIRCEKTINVRYKTS